MLRYLVIFSSISVTGYFATVMMNQTFEWMKEIAILIILPIGAFVAGVLFLISWLTKRDNPFLKTMGEALGTGFTYTAVFQGLMFTTLVFWALGTMVGMGDVPESKGRFLFDFAFGSGYLSVFVMGASGLTILCTYRKTLKRVFGAVYAAVTIALPLYMLIFQKKAMTWLSEERPLPFIAGIVIYYLICSIAAMAVLSNPEKATILKDRKDELREKYRNRA